MLAIDTICLFTLTTTHHWFGVTFATEVLGTFMTSFDRWTSIAIAIRRITAVTTGKRLERGKVTAALKVPAVNALLAYAFIATFAESLVRV